MISLQLHSTPSRLQHVSSGLVQDLVDDVCDDAGWQQVIGVTSISSWVNPVTTDHPLSASLVGKYVYWCFGCVHFKFIFKRNTQTTSYPLPLTLLKNISHGQGSLAWFISRPLSHFMLSEGSWLLLLIIRVLISLDWLSIHHCRLHT